MDRESAAVGAVRDDHEVDPPPLPHAPDAEASRPPVVAWTQSPGVRALDVRLVPVTPLLKTPFPAESKVNSFVDPALPEEISIK
jgi:hypothetical protein